MKQIENRTWPLPEKHKGGMGEKEKEKEYGKTAKEIQQPAGPAVVD
ncbi:hypothetical protein [Dysgonomonas capnocytophagoides]